MRPRTITQTGVGTSAPFPVDWRQQNFQVSLMCVVTGTVTYTIEHTLDNIVDGETPTWFPHSTLAGISATADGNYAFPITAWRVNVTAGTGSVAVKFVQQSGN